MNRWLPWLFCCAVVTVVAAAPLPAQVPMEKITGDVVALDGNTLRMRTTAGEALAVVLRDNVRISGRSAANPTDIAPGAYVGTTAATQADGTLLATEVHIFPASMRGTGEGHRPTPSAPGSTMTNATVVSVSGAGGAPGSTAGNATIAAVAGGAPARTVKLKYRGGEQVVTVPSGVPIVMVEAADRTQLIPGAHVIVYVAHRADGSIVGNRISVGLRGFAPPA